MRNRSDRISELYHAVLARPPEARHAFLQDACGDDDALRQEVESLLQYDAASGAFLQRPAAAAFASPLPAPRAITMVDRALGPYTIVGLLGAGGMGEVYRARDTKLGRDVAIKILPPHLMSDPERRVRFAREARLLATLNHPHIGTIYGLEEADGFTALVLELVEGPTLAERLERGPLPISDALGIAHQIAEALESAHEKRIVHRDLKPANIVLQGTSGTPRVKVLDFGLAKALTSGSGAVSAESFDGTADGRILGTPAYMSPEQARGLAVDEQADVWAFGCVLFEMLTARRTFAGETATDTLAHVLEREPDWSIVPKNLPPGIRTLLRRCLRKDPQSRLRDIADARMAIEDADVAAEGGSAQPESPRVHPNARLAWSVAGLMGAATLALALLYVRSTPPPAGPLEFPLPPPEDWNVRGDLSVPRFEIAPDGQHIAVATQSNGIFRLWVRPIARPEWRQLAGTEGGRCPFWSSDSRHLAFFADDKLKIVPIGGGAPKILTDVPTAGSFPGGAWSRNDVIVFGSSGPGPLRKISVNTGGATPVTTLKGMERWHRWPSFLPDGEHFLYVAIAETHAELRIGSLVSDDTITLGPTESHAVYASARLLFVSRGQLMAQPFDVRSRTTTGAPVVIAEEAGLVSFLYRGEFSASANGVLGYGRVGLPRNQLTWMDRRGTRMGTAGEPSAYVNLDLSPTEDRVAVSRHTQPRGEPWNVDIWVVDLTRDGAPDRLTVDPARDFDPVWSHDGRMIAFNSSRVEGRFSLFRRPSHGGGEDDLLVKSTSVIVAPHWSRDGRFLMYTEGEVGAEDLRYLPLAGEAKPVDFLNAPYRERSGVFSPNVEWVAYESDESRRLEIYVRPFPHGESRIPISRDGGVAPRWRADGREIFFLSPDGTLMSAEVTSSRGEFVASVPKPLFRTDLVQAGNHPYAVSNDGKRFLIPVIINPPAPPPLTIVLNWPASLRQ